MELYTVDISGEQIKKENMIGALNLNLDQKQTIAFVGAGGKTTSMLRLSEELASVGKLVFVTTTTHMFLPKKYGVLDEDKNKTLNLLNTHHIVVVGTPCGSGKMTGVTDSYYQWMKTVADFILVEADGSKGLPLKAANFGEPVLPYDTDLFIILVGLSCLYKPVLDICHRPELASTILNCNLEHKIEPRDIAQLIKVCYCKDFTKHFKIILNQCDHISNRIHVDEVVQSLGVKECILSYNMNSNTEVV